MDIEKEISSLSAETIALQHVLTHVLHGISKLGPAMEAAVRQGFDDAASFAENEAIRHGKAASPEHLVKAVRIIEELRTATLGDKDKPRHGV